MTHRYHPNPSMKDPTEAKLYDNCERCDEQAEYLHGLDQQKLVWFWSLMYGLKFEGKSYGRDLTQNEVKAINRLYGMAVLLERMTGISPSPANLITMKVAQ